MLDLSTNEARLALATKWAQKYALDRFLVCAVIEQESSWNPWAVRYEPLFFKSYIKPGNPDSPSTSQVMRACSFGLMQVMGQTAIEFGWRGTFLTELCDPDTGVDFGCRKLQRELMLHGNAPGALQGYNGGGNPNYAQQVLARVGHYSLPTTEGAD